MSAPFATTTKFIRSSVLPVAAFALIACSDGGLSTEPGLAPFAPTTPIAYAPATVTLRGTVDLEAGTMTFEPVSPLASGFALPAGISASIYGNQGATVRIYNSPVAVVNPSSPGKKTFSANVGVRNLLPHAIGDEQAAGIPQDTMGIFVFLNTTPTVTATSSPCSPACTVSAANAHGFQAFSAANQAYWHWQERIGAAGGGSDTTRTRKLWVFQADTQVTSFSFDVSVSAAWPAPYESRWKVEYLGDSVPHTTAEPRWRRTTSGALGTVTLNSPSAGIATLTTPNGASQWFSRRDSISSTTNSYIEARLRRNAPLSGNAEVSFGIDDNNKFIAVGVTDNKVGFLKTDRSFLGNQIETTPTVFHTYRIRKFAADSVQLVLDGVRVDSRTYASLENSTNTTIPSFFFFGGPGYSTPPASSGGNSSSWDYVIYEIGVSQP